MTTPQTFISLPPELLGLVQENMLVREFSTGFVGTFAYRKDADQEPMEMGQGETKSYTRKGRKGPKTKPLVPSDMNASITNGITPSGAGLERYTLTLRDYGDSMFLNMRQNMVKIKSEFLDNARINGYQGSQTLEHLARNCWDNAYFGGDTRAVAAFGSFTTTKVYVDDIRGFQKVMVNGIPTDVSVGAPLTVTVTGPVTGEVTISVTGAVADGGNQSTAGNVANDGGAGRGISGFLAYSSAQTIADGDRLVAINAPRIVRAGGRQTTAQIQSRDVNKLSLIQDGKLYLENQGAPKYADGTYHYVAPNESIRQLFDDPDFKSLFQTQHGAREIKEGDIFELLGVTFFSSTEAIFQDAITGGSSAEYVPQRILRPILTAKGGLVQGNFAGNSDWLGEMGGPKVAMIDTVNDIAMITLAPIDYMQQQVVQSWLWGGDMNCPTNATTTPTTVPSAGFSAYKSAIGFEHAGAPQS